MAPRKTKKETEERQDADENVPHPRKTAVLFGQERAEAAFLNAFCAGTVHHAWLLTGERGIGKATFAYRAARFLLSGGGNAGPLPSPVQNLGVSPAHPVARQIAAGAHPSLFVLGKDGDPAGEKSAIGVEAARKLRGFLSLTSTSGWRAVIVDAANDLTSSSANALLKAIEEPPPRTVFFLISHGSGSILPTIRSRCIRLAMLPLGNAGLEQAISAACGSSGLPTPDRSTLEKMLANASGSPGQALAFLAGGLLPLAEKLDRILASLPKLDMIAAHDLIREVAGARNAEMFARLCDLFEERIEQRARENALGAGTAKRAGDWARLWEKFRERRQEVETLNLDKGAFLISIFSDIEDMARESARARLS